MSLKTWIFILVLIISSCQNTSNQKEDRNVANKNQTIETILDRSSIREYTAKEIEPKHIETLLRAGMAAPSSRDRRPWHFIVLSDKEKLTRLGEQLNNASVLKNANKAIVVCGDVNLSDNCWFLDCAAATQNILLAAHALEIGAVWTAVYPYEDREQIVSKELLLPENIRALAIVPLGYPNQKHTPKEKYDPGRIHTNNW